MFRLSRAMNTGSSGGVQPGGVRSRSSSRIRFASEVAGAGALAWAAAPLHGADPTVGGAFPGAELPLGLLAVVEGDEDVGALIGPVGAETLGARGEVHVVSVAGATDGALGRSR